MRNWQSVVATAEHAIPASDRWFGTIPGPRYLRRYSTCLYYYLTTVVPYLLLWGLSNVKPWWTSCLSNKKIHKEFLWLFIYLYYRYKENNKDKALYMVDALCFSLVFIVLTHVTVSHFFFLISCCCKFNILNVGNFFSTVSNF